MRCAWLTPPASPNTSNVTSAQPVHLRMTRMLPPVARLWEESRMPGAWPRLHQVLVAQPHGERLRNALDGFPRVELDVHLAHQIGRQRVQRAVFQEADGLLHRQHVSDFERDVGIEVLLLEAVEHRNPEPAS